MNIERIVKEIKAGNLVITPTDTVYGILADACNIDAVRKVYDAKRRSRTKPLLLLVNDEKMLKEYAADLTPFEEEIIREYWPGKLTILLPRNRNVFDAIVNGGDYVGIRMPDNVELREIIAKVGRPLVSTSANISEKLTITNPAELEPELSEKIAYIEDAGTVEGDPSSIIKIVNGKIQVLRDGEVARKVLKNTKLDT